MYKKKTIEECLRNAVFLISKSFLPFSFLLQSLLGAKWFWHGAFPSCLSRASDVANGHKRTTQVAGWEPASFHASLLPEIPVSSSNNSPCRLGEERTGYIPSATLAKPRSHGIVLEQNYRRRWCESCPHPQPVISWSWQPCPQTMWNHSRHAAYAFQSTQTVFLFCTYSF